MHNGELLGEIAVTIYELQSLRNEQHKERTSAMEKDLKEIEENCKKDPIGKSFHVIKLICETNEIGMAQLGQEVLAFCAQIQPHADKLVELRQQINADEEVIAIITAETERLIDFYRPQVDELSDMLNETLAELDELVRAILCQQSIKHQFNFRCNFFLAKSKY